MLPPAPLRPVLCTLLIAAACADRPAPGPADDEPAVASDTAGTSGPAPAVTIATDCSAGPVARDRTLCPPDRAGPIRAATTRSELASLFGAERIADREVEIGEGQMGHGSIIDPGGAERITVVWTDSTRTTMVAISDLGPAWRTPGGIGAGSSLEDIVAVLGPVDVLGFGWDYGGTLVLDGTRWEGAGLFLRMQPRDPSARETEAWTRIRGDRPYPATHPDVRALDLVVGRVDIRLH